MEKLMIEMLNKIGLSQIESEVYLSALKSKTKTAYDISKNLKTRSSVYGTLDKLKEKNLITESKNKNKKIYNAKKIEDLVENKKEELESVYKNILTLSKKYIDNTGTEIKIFKGEKQIKEAIRYGLAESTKKEILCIYPSSSKITISPTDTIYYNENIYLSKKGFKKIILSDKKVRDEYKTLDKDLGFERYTSEDEIFKKVSESAIGFEKIGDKLIKIYFYKDSTILILENKNLATLFDFIFNLNKTNL